LADDYKAWPYGLRALAIFLGLIVGGGISRAVGLDRGSSHLDDLLPDVTILFASIFAMQVLFWAVRTAKLDARK
jgi:hypothetical protein